MYQYNIQIHSAYIELLPFTIRDTVPQEKQLRGNSKSDALGCLIGNRMVIGIFAFWVGAMLVGECTLWRGIIYPEKRRKCLFQAAGTAYHPPPTPDPRMYTYPLQQNWLSHEEDLIWEVGDQSWMLRRFEQWVISFQGESSNVYQILTALHGKVNGPPIPSHPKIFTSNQSRRDCHEVST